MSQSGLSQAGDIAATARRIPGVVALDGGPYDEVATHAPGERVLGVRLTVTGGEIRIVVDSRQTALTTGEQVRQAIEALTRMPWTVVISDIVPVGGGS